MNIVVYARSYGFGAFFYGIPNMPEDVELPLPFGSQCAPSIVLQDMRKRFPGADVRYIHD